MAKLIALSRGIACVVIVAAVWEACARVDDYAAEGAPLLEPYNLNSLYTDDALGIRGRPYAHYRKFRLNSLGYRGPELRPGHTRLVCVGSSETFGSYEKEGEEYPRQLERELNARTGALGVDVLNAAYPGVRIPTMLRRLPELVEKVRPRIMTIYPSLTAYIYGAAPGDPVKTPAMNRFEARIAEKIRTLMVASIPTSVQTWMKELLIARATRHSRVRDRVPDTHVDRFRQDLNELIDAVLAHGALPVLVTHATRFGGRVVPEERYMLVAWRKFYPTLAEEGFLDMERRLNDVIRQVALARNLPLVDAARSMPAGERYFGDFVHFTDEGAALLARMIAGEVAPLLGTNALPVARGSEKKAE